MHMSDGMRHSMSHSCVSGMGLDLCNTSKEDTVSKSKKHATTHAKEITMAVVIADATPENIAIAKGWVADNKRSQRMRKDKRDSQRMDIMANAIREWQKAGDA